jgi:PAS domain S-box-containing protein
MIALLLAFYYNAWLIVIAIGSISLAAYNIKLHDDVTRYHEKNIAHLSQIKQLQEAGRQKDEVIASSIGLRMSNELLQEANNEFGIIFNALEEVLFSIDIVNWRLIQVSAACIKVFGYTPIEFIADSDLWIKIVHPEDQHILEANYEKLKDGRTLTNQYRIIHKNGSTHWIEAKVIPTLDYRGHVVRIDGICNDITQRVKLRYKLSEEKRKKQQQITAAVITAQENERSFLGEELHDNINPILATAKLYMECATSTDHKERWVELLKDSKGFITTAMEEIRLLSKSLIPPTLGEIGLIDAITDMIDSVEKVNNLKFISHWKGLNEAILSDKLKLTIFRIIQEQLNNIFKYAKAQTVTISLKQIDRRLELIVKDDGIGFDVSQKRNGVGIQNMISRTELFNGSVTINSGPGKGCELLVSFSSQPELPFTKQNAEI